MCERCGCGSGTVTALNLKTGEVIVLDHAAQDHDHDDGHGHGHEHVHADGTRHWHAHAAPGHVHENATEAGHPQAHAPATLVELEARVLAKNDALAAGNRAWLDERQVLGLNLMSAPGAGKTTLLERTIRDLAGELPLVVIEGDQATAKDGERIRAAGADVIQLNTGTGCHLEAEMVARALAELDPGAGSIVVIENVGNLVCPAMFDLGEQSRVVILSASEGDDKPLKYPHMFAAADLLVVNKVDLVPYVDFDVVRAVENARQVNPDIAAIVLSARTGEGLGGWYDWLRGQMAARRDGRITPASRLGVPPASR